MIQIFKNKRFIFALSFFLLINISFIANVKAETEYFDENGVMYKLLFDDTQLKDFVQRDFALYYNVKDKQDQDIANITQTTKSGTYTYSLGFAKNKDLKILIFETSETWQETHNEKYIVNVLPDYVSGNYNSIDASIYENVKVVKGKDNWAYYFFKGDRYYKDREFGMDNLNFNKNDSNVKVVNEDNLSNLTGSSNLIIIVNKDGTIYKQNDIWNKDSNLEKEINNNARYNLIYSSMDVWNYEQTEIIKPKEEFEIKKPIEEQIEIVKGEIGKNIKFQYNNLKENYLIDIKRKDIESKKNLEWKYSPIRPNITFSSLEFEDLTDSYIFERTIYNENKDIIFHKEEIIEFGGLFDEINENSDVNDYFGFIKIFLKKASAIVSPIFEIFNYFFKNLDPFLQLGTFVCFTVLIIYFILRGVRK